MAIRRRQKSGSQQKSLPLLVEVKEKVQAGCEEQGIITLLLGRWENRKRKIFSILPFDEGECMRVCHCDELVLFNLIKVDV